ncbi:MAG: cellulose biosynthesis cyclic di-GMP-binding regulatory protein BcsB, partial [Anaerolineae bacterium]|nr:cellulose biosynthesis cyclic di-GMP-binding regulatory protein BcsB [Anaerolineae bacterium]
MTLDRKNILTTTLDHLFRGGLSGPNCLARIGLLLILLTILLNPRATPAHAQAPTAFTFEALGYRHDSKATGTTASLHFDFAVPRRWTDTPPTLNLHFSHSALLLGDYSQMSVLYNDIPLADVWLTPNNAADGRLQITVPPTALEPGRHQLKLIVYQRLHTDQCLDGNAPPALWTVIHKDSTISFETSPTGPDLAWFPEPFSVYGRAAVEPVSIAVVLPRQPGEAELRAAGLAMAKLGQLAGIRNLDISVSLGELPAQGQTLVVARADRLGELLDVEDSLPLQLNDGAFVDASGQVVSPQVGVIQLARPAAERGLLVLSGGSDLGVTRAALALADDNSLRLMSGAFTLVEETPAPAYPPEAIEPATTLEALTGVGNRRVEGITIEELPYCFRLPPNWQVEPEASLNLKYVYSPSLWVERSSLQVKLNTATLASVPLGDDPAGLGQLTVPIPAHELIDGYNCLRFIFTLRLHQDQCVIERGGEAWAEISAVSPINLPHSVTKDKAWLPDLAQYPYPFNLDTDLAATSIILPDAPTATEIEGALQLAARLGSEARHPTLQLDLKPAGSWHSQIDSLRHLVLIGDSQRNAVVTELESAIVELNAFNEITLTFRQELALRQQNGAAVAAAELIRSPWSDGRGILHISGAETALPHAFELLSTNRAEESLSGNIVTVTESALIRTIDTLSRPKRPAEIAVTAEGEIVIEESAEPATIRWFLIGGAV